MVTDQKDEAGHGHLEEVRLLDAADRLLALFETGLALDPNLGLAD